MWPFGKSKYSIPEFKIEISTTVITDKYKYLLKKKSLLSSPYSSPYELVDMFENYDEAVAALKHHADFPQYYDNNGNRVA